MQLHLNTKSSWWLIEQELAQKSRANLVQAILQSCAVLFHAEGRTDGWTGGRTERHDGSNRRFSQCCEKRLKIIEKICLTINTQAWFAAVVIWKQNFQQHKLIFMQLSTAVLLKHVNYWFSLQQQRCPLLSKYEQISYYLSGHSATITWIHYHCHNIVTFYGTGQKALNSS